MPLTPSKISVSVQLSIPFHFVREYSQSIDHFYFLMDVWMLGVAMLRYLRLS